MGKALSFQLCHSGKTESHPFTPSSFTTSQLKFQDSQDRGSIESILNPQNLKEKFIAVADEENDELLTNLQIELNIPNRQLSTVKS